MKHNRIANYLRFFRKRAALSQRDLAFLLGVDHPQLVSRYEKRRLPPLKTALACELVLGVPVAELFAGVTDELQKDLKKKGSSLAAHLQRRLGKPATNRIATSQKLRWLAERYGNTTPAA